VQPGERRRRRLPDVATRRVGAAGGKEHMAAIRKISVSTGIYWIDVRSADVRILCGCPEDAVKHLLRTGLIVPTEVQGVACETGPNAILLSDLSIQNGRVCSRSEFPVLQMLYNQGMLVPNHPRNTGMRPMLIGSRRQVDAQMAYIFRGNYGLASHEELLETGLTAEQADEMMRMKLAFAFGRIRPSDELVEPVYVEHGAVEIRGGNCPWQSGGSFSSEYYGHRLDLERSEVELFSGLRTNMQRNVKKASKSGVKVEFFNTLEATDEYYKLNCITRKEHGIPPQPRKFFRKIQKHVLAKIERHEKETERYTSLTVNIALSYGARQEILNAVKNLAEEVIGGKLEAKDIDEKIFSERLYTAGQPDPDLIIRTGGEIRLSNYEQIEQMLTYCHLQPNINQVDKTIGGETLEIEFHVKSLHEMLKLIDEFEVNFPKTIERFGDRIDGMKKGSEKIIELKETFDSIQGNEQKQSEDKDGAINKN